MVKRYPSLHQRLHYRADSGAERIGHKIKSFLLQTFGTTDTWSSTDN